MGWGLWVGGARVLVERATASGGFKPALPAPACRALRQPSSTRRSAVGAAGRPTGARGALQQACLVESPRGAASGSSGAAVAGGLGLGHASGLACGRTGQREGRVGARANPGRGNGRRGAAGGSPRCSRRVPRPWRGLRVGWRPPLPGRPDSYSYRLGERGRHPQALMRPWWQGRELETTAQRARAASTSSSAVMQASGRAAPGLPALPQGPGTSQGASRAQRPGVRAAYNPAPPAPPGQRSWVAGCPRPPVFSLCGTPALQPGHWPTMDRVRTSCWWQGTSVLHLSAARPAAAALQCVATPHAAHLLLPASQHRMLLTSG